MQQYDTLGLESAGFIVQRSICHALAALSRVKMARIEDEKEKQVHNVTPIDNPKSISSHGNLADYSSSIPTSAAAHIPKPSTSLYGPPSDALKPHRR